MSEGLLEAVTAAVRRARVAWQAAHVTGALEAGPEPDAYLAHVAMRACLDWMDAAVSGVKGPE